MKQVTKKNYRVELKAATKKYFKGLSWLFVFAALVTLGVFFNSYSNDQQELDIFVGLLVYFIPLAGLFLYWGYKKEKKPENNELSYSDRCKIIALELKSGKRFWGLNYFSGSRKSYFAPLDPENIDEFGQALHSLRSKETISRLIEAGELENMQMAIDVMKAFDEIEK